MQARSSLLFLAHRSLWLLAIGVCDFPLSAATLTPPPATGPQITQPSEPSSSELPKIVEKLAAQSSLSAADCATLARETITHGQAARQSGQPVKPAILHDGLAAVDQGEAADAKADDWSGLRSQLQELLKPPPQQDKKDDEKKEDEKNEEQKKDEQQKQQDQNKDQQKQDEQQSEDQKQEQQKNEQQEQQSEQQKQEKKEQEQQQSQQPDKPEPPKDTQTVGGEKPEDDERKEHPELAVPLQKLDQVRDKDSPAELFQLLQTDDPAPAGTPKKDW